LDRLSESLLLGAGPEEEEEAFTYNLEANPGVMSPAFPHTVRHELAARIKRGQLVRRGRQNGLRSIRRV